MLRLFVSGGRLLPTQVSKRRLTWRSSREELNQPFKFLYVNQTRVPGLNVCFVSPAELEIVSVISLTDYNNIFSWSNSSMVKLEVPEDVTSVLELLWHIQTSVISILDWLLWKQGFSQAGTVWRMDVNVSISYINTWLPACSSTAVVLDQMSNTEEASLSCSVPRVEVARNSRGDQLQSSPVGHQKTCVAGRDGLSCTFSQSLSCTVLTGPTRNHLCAACRCASLKPSRVSRYSDDSIPQASLNQQRCNYSRSCCQQSTTEHVILNIVSFSWCWLIVDKPCV